MIKWMLIVLSMALSLSSIADPCLAEFQKGPYLQYVVNASNGRIETDTIKILWKTDAITGATTGQVQYRKTTSATYVEPVPSGWPSDGITDRFHEVLVTGLDPGTRYCYKVLAGTLESDEFTFTTPVSDSTIDFSFIVFGDVQCRTDSSGEDCRKRRAAVVNLIESLSPKPCFLVSTGDMWWDNDGLNVQTFFNVDQGTDGVWSDPDITITDPPRLLQNNPLFPTYGNHENAENPDSSGANRFTDYFAIPATLSTNEADAYYSFNFGNSHFLVINTELDCSGPAYGEDCAISDPQLSAITNDLISAGSTSENIFVFMHRSAHSNGIRHGSEENPQLSQILGPLFRENNVDVVFQGHDHIYERFMPDTVSGYPFTPSNIHLIEQGVTYIVTGGGGSLESDPVLPAGTTESDTDVDHPLTSAVSERTLEAIHVHVSGDQVYVRVLTVDEDLFGAAADLDGDGTPAEQSYLLDYFYVRPTTVTKGLQWLRDNQNPDGSFHANPAVTALGALAFLNAGHTEDDPYDSAVREAIDYIIGDPGDSSQPGFVQADGSIDSGTGNSNYETSISILPLVATYNDSYEDPIIADAKDYLLSIQNADPGSQFYGGWGYGDTSLDWADLSNTQWTLMGLHFAHEALGLSYEQDWVDNALTWIRTCQNTDGGLTYNGTELGPQYTSESYASMTYAGIWSYALLGLDGASDEISNAMDWAAANYSITDNTPFDTWTGDQGDFALYYYYVTMAKALSMIDVSEVGGNFWEEDLTGQLASLQTEDGYWVNSNTREWEGVPALCTAYAILALQAFQDPPANVWMEVILGSPAELVVYDPQGRSCSKDGCTIPGATFEVDGTSGYLAVTLPALESGHYRFEITGTGTGTVHLTVNGYRGEELISTVYKEFTINIYELWEADVMISSLVGPLTLDMVQEPELSRLEVLLDILPCDCPNTFNVSSKGMLPAAILGADGFDVNRIDPDSVYLEGIYRERYSYEDVTGPHECDCGSDCEIPDDYTDMTLKFDRIQIASALGDVSDGDAVELTLTGSLKSEFGGTPIQATDVVIIKKKK